MLLDRWRRNRALHGRGDLVCERSFAYGSYAATAALLSFSFLPGDARARRGEAGDAAGVRSRRIEVVLDHHVDRRRVGPAEQRRIALRDVPAQRLPCGVRRVRS